jgi:hypothetical protein
VPRRRARLARPGDRQCRNFQTARLASLCPGDAPELERALTALNRLTVVGLVERFEDAVKALEAELAATYPGFFWETVRANTTSSRNGDADTSLNSLLMAENAGDLDVLDAAKAAIGTR